MEEFEFFIEEEGNGGNIARLNDNASYARPQSVPESFEYIVVLA